jgi:hypothetical protein
MSPRPGLFATEPESNKRIVDVRPIDDHLLILFVSRARS